MKKILCGNEMDRMPKYAFKIMSFMFHIADLFKSPTHRLDQFNIQKGQIIIDYGCGTGRYLKQASELVGKHGLVYAVDIHELAIESAFSQMEKYNLKNVLPILTDGITVDLSVHSVDIIYCLDMFHMVSEPNRFLQELNRLAKSDCILYLEDGHQPRARTKEKVLNSGCWDIAEEHKSFITCNPKATL